MIIRPARTELFHADRQADRRTGIYTYCLYWSGPTSSFRLRRNSELLQRQLLIKGVWFATLRGPRLLDLALVINGCYQHGTIFGVQKRYVSTMTTVSESTVSEIRLYYPYAPPVHTHSKLKLITNSLYLIVTARQAARYTHPLTACPSSSLALTTSASTITVHQHSSV